MNQIAYSLNHVKAVTPRVISLHTPTGETVAFYHSPNHGRLASQLAAWEPQILQGWTVIDWRDGEPVGAIADRDIKV